jgi:hypothetical protein
MHVRARARPSLLTSRKLIQGKTSALTFCSSLAFIDDLLSSRSREEPCSTPSAIEPAEVCQ